MIALASFYFFPFHVHPTGSAHSVHHFGVAHQTSLRSLQTMMSSSNSPSSGRRVAYSGIRSLPRRIMFSSRHSRMGTTVLLSQLSAATELLIINLVTQQDPEPDPQLSCGGHFRLPQTFLHQLVLIKTLQLHILANRMPHPLHTTENEEVDSSCGSPTSAASRRRITRRSPAPEQGLGPTHSHKRRKPGRRTLPPAK